MTAIHEYDGKVKRKHDSSGDNATTPSQQCTEYPGGGFNVTELSNHAKKQKGIRFAEERPNLSVVVRRGKRKLPMTGSDDVNPCSDAGGIDVQSLSNLSKRDNVRCLL